MTEAQKLPAWNERYEGGDPYAEADRLHKLGERILWIQKRLQERDRSSLPRRAFHSKIRMGVENAQLEVHPDLPAALRVGFIQPNKVYPVTVRLSNASGSVQHDAKKDMRGIALRVKVSDAEYHDLLLTNGPVSHARNGTEFVAFAAALAGSRLRLPFRLLFGLGLLTSVRMFRNVMRYATAKIDSLATETYWGRGAMRWDTQAGRLKLVPVPAAAPPAPPDKAHPDYLRTELADRLRAAEIVFEFHFQPFVDEYRTPIEDASVEWKVADSPPIPFARLVIPRQDIDAAEGRAAEGRVDVLAFNPWHTTDLFRPLGHINRARKVVYRASSAHRLGQRFLAEVPLRNRVFASLSRGVFRVVNWFVEWHRLPTLLSVLNLDGFRHVLRKENLHDT